MFKKRKYGFSLAEMMVVMLLVAIVLAATAPMVTRKVSRNIDVKQSNSSDKVFDKLPSDPTNAVEYLKGRKQRIFMNGQENGYVGIVEPGISIPKNSVLFGNNEIVKGSYARENDKDGVNLVGIGFKTTNSVNTVAIGYNAHAKAIGSIAIGYDVTAKGGGAIAIGNYAETAQPKNILASEGGIAIGRYAKSKGISAISIGDGAEAKAYQSVAIGNLATVEPQAKNSIAIGNVARAEYENTIVLGNEDSTVYIPGNLVVNHSALIGYRAGVNDNLYFRPFAEEDGRHFAVLNAGDWKGDNSNVSMALDESIGAEPRVVVGPYNTAWRSKRTVRGEKCEEWKSDYKDNNRTHIHYTNPKYTDDPGSYRHSDIRLKNVGEKFTAGLDELNKLDFYNFTLKKDEAKTPHVGVIAQDLQKVFPDAVTADKDGWLLVRWDEMFYAALNAIKELNAKVTEIASKVCQITKDVSDMKTTLANQQVIIDAQAKLIEEQQTELKKLSEKVEKLERRKK